MQHDILGQIEREKDDGDGIARIPCGDLTIEIRIIPDDASFDEALELAASVVKRIGDLDSLAKTIAAAELVDTYNNGWNEYDEVQEDGTITAVSNPQLSEEEFAKKLTLDGVNVYGSGMLSFFYDDETMFWGHSVVVTSMNGIEFSDTHAQIFG
jgi:hypothetical protein